MRYLVRRFSSVRVRLTLGNTLTFAFVLITLGIAFRFLAQNYLLNALDHEIKKQAQAFQTKQRIDMVFVGEASTKGNPIPVPLPPTRLLRLVAPDFPLDPNSVQNIMQSSVRDRDRHATGDIIQQTFVTDSSGQFLARTFDFGRETPPFLARKSSLRCFRPEGASPQRYG